MDLNVSQFLSPGRKEFIKGTLLLTGAGLFCRILGFFYRIYMSRTIGAEGLGLYNMIHPFSALPLPYVQAPSRRHCPSMWLLTVRKAGLFFYVAWLCH